MAQAPSLRPTTAARPAPRAAAPAGSVGPAVRVGADRPATKRVGALSALWPFLRPYRVLMAAALVALVVTASISLILPVAVRRIVDGFDQGAQLLDKYFLAAIGITTLLAVGTALRYALVTRLGERVVADIRKAVFDRVIGLSPGFFEKVMTGEIISRITTDTTLIQSVIGSSVSIALRNLLILIGGMAMLIWTSVKLSMLVLALVPLVVVPIIVLGRRLRALSRENQEWIAQSAGAASEMWKVELRIRVYAELRVVPSRPDRASIVSRDHARSAFCSLSIIP